MKDLNSEICEDLVMAAQVMELSRTDHKDESAKYKAL